MNEETLKNEQTWDELARNGVLCSQPRLELTPQLALQYLNRHGFYNKDLSQKDVLCLASGGGQQSVAFALLGADVTVLDFSQEQLDKDQFAAEKYQVELRRIKADMRDLSALDNASFDVVYQPYSINYIPNATSVFDEVNRVLKPGGFYDLMLHNPYVHGTWKDGCWVNEWEEAELWQAKGYPIWQPYKDGYPIETYDPNWNFTNRDQESVKIKSPQEYRHTLSTVLNGLISRGFEILKFEEELGQDYTAKPGTWEHYKSCAPPWLYVFCQKKNS